MSKQPTRRNVLIAGAAVTSFTILPSRRAKAESASPFPDKKQVSPGERLNIGFIGAGGRGEASINGCMHHTIHTLCDVDAVRAAPAFGHFTKAKKYEDWRVMLDREAKNLDGVVVSTPDHTHAVATMAAMQLGLPVYTEKPLTRTISEARALTTYAVENKMVTQMGNQGHSFDQARMAVEWIQAGVLGNVREVHCWTNRPVWPQGIVRPVAEKVPATMNWDLWLGPAPDAPYSSKIAPFNWRGFWEYGSGALGDMAAHIIDHPVWALGLGQPETVEVEFSRSNPASTSDTFPVSTWVTYQFAARGGRPPVTLKWFDGKNLPPRPKGLEETRVLTDSGIIYYGDKYNMMQDCYGKSPRIFPESDMKEAIPQLKKIPKSLPRVSSQHEEWIQAIKANDPSIAKSGFATAGPLTEMMLLGAVAARVGPGTKLIWDSKNMKTNNELANQYIQHAYRKGWSL